MFKKKFAPHAPVFRALFVALFAVAVFLIVHVAAGSTGQTSVAAGDDSGVAVCKVMAAPAEHPKLDDQWRKERMAAFEASNYPELREAGVNLTEAAYRMENEMESADLDKLNELTNRLRITHSTLRAACKNHGVDLPPLT